jgi:hypothetical protein
MASQQPGPIELNPPRHHEHLPAPLSTGACDRHRPTFGQTAYKSTSTSPSSSRDPYAVLRREIDFDSPSRVVSSGISSKAAGYLTQKPKHQPDENRFVPNPAPSGALDGVITLPGMQRIYPCSLTPEEYAKGSASRKIVPEQGCPRCGRQGRLHRHGTYERGITTSAGLVIRILVARFLCLACGGTVSYTAKNVENAWQYSKLYPQHADSRQQPTPEYWAWAKQGWNNPRAERYPMGRGAKPLCALWKGNHLDYIEARKQIYVPIYATAVAKTPVFTALTELATKVAATGCAICLWDFDGYNHQILGMSLEDVLNCPSKKMGHAFVLAALLTENLKDFTRL